MILIVILYALWAASISSSKELLLYCTPIFMTGARMTIAGALLLAYQYFYAHHHFNFHKKDTYLYAQMIIFGILISYILRFWALEDISATKLMFIYNLAPFTTSLHSYFFLKEKMSSRKWWGMAIGCIGLIPMLLTSSNKEAATGEFYFISWQEFAVFISVITNSYSWIVMRKLVRDNGYSPMMVNGICMFIGGLLALLIALPTEGPVYVTSIVPFMSWLIFIIIISNIICHNLYGHLLRDYSATFLSFAGFMGPLFAALYGRLFFGETVTWHLYVSTIIVFAGLYIFYKDELREVITPIE